MKHNNIVNVEKMEIKTKYETLQCEKKTMFLCGLGRKNLLAINLTTMGTQNSPFECLSQVCVFNNGENTKYIIKNRTAKDRAVKVTFIQ